jgi:DNA-binding NarL/FixJ family response regulator
MEALVQLPSHVEPNVLASTVAKILHLKAVAEPSMTRVSVGLSKTILDAIDYWSNERGNTREETIRDLIENGLASIAIARLTLQHCR